MARSFIVLLARLIGSISLIYLPFKPSKTKQETHAILKHPKICQNMQFVQTSWITLGRCPSPRLYLSGKIKVNLQTQDSACNILGTNQSRRYGTDRPRSGGPASQGAHYAGGRRVGDGSPQGISVDVSSDPVAPVAPELPSYTCYCKHMNS